jgi:hypothetical protein
MSSRYQVTEPHPTSSTYLHCGRGGAGNYVKAPKTTSGNRSSTVLGSDLPKSTSKFASGRGGAGNIHDASERTMFSFDEELARQSSREKKMNEGGVYHVGRGGAGNLIPSTHPSSSRKDSSSSAGSDNSERSGFFGRLSHTFERR